MLLKGLGLVAGMVAAVLCGLAIWTVTTTVYEDHVMLQRVVAVLSQPPPARAAGTPQP